MLMLEMAAAFFIVPALVFGYFGLLFGLGQGLSPERLRLMRRNLSPLQLNLWQMMFAVALAAFVIFVFANGLGFALTLLASSSLVLAWFFRAWSHEFVFLMGLRDDDLPGRHDKLVWAFLLFAAAPIAVWFFRSYRLAHWPEPVADSSSALGPEQSRTTVTQPA